MQVTHEWRVFEGKRVAERGMNSPPAVYSALQTYGFYWLMPFIVALTRAKTLDVEPLNGESWRFIFRLDYAQPVRGRQSRLRSARLVILPQLNRFQIPPIPLDPEMPLSLEFLSWYLCQFQPH